jgi:lysophospholipase L1-like esterase
MQTKSFPLLPVLVLIGLLLFNANVSAQDEPKAKPLEPDRIASTGDSITEAIDAELPFANHWASWVNGYHGFWEWLFGLTNVNSHNQRILRIFGRRGHRNYMEAESGADSYDFAQQAAQAVAHDASYVTVFMGHNDVCQNDFDDIPSDGEFEKNMRAGFEILKNGLPDGATVYVVGLVDIYELYEAAQEKKALGIVDCEVLWAFTLFDLFPCGTMLSPFISETQRAFTSSRNLAFNGILENLVAHYQATDSNHHYFYTDKVSNFGAIPEHFISDIDCFHPSADGQTKLSEITWDDGPFKAW